MGISNRDYTQGGSSYGYGGYSPSASGLSAVGTLIIINVVVYFLQLWGNGAGVDVTGWLSLNLHDMKSFEIWRLLTYGFCHDTRGMMHLAINMYVLWMFGRLVEPIYGKREFMMFFLTGVILSGVGHVLFQMVSRSPAGVVGASGGVMAVTFLTAMIYPRTTILIMFIIPVELRFLAVIYAIADVMGAFGGNSGVAHVAHLAGAGFGVAYKYYGWRLTGFSSNWFKNRLFPHRKSRPKKMTPPPASKHVKLYEPPSESELEGRVDAILEKIHTQGEGSLTEEEREILKQASQRYKNRTKP